MLDNKFFVVFTLVYIGGKFTLRNSNNKCRLVQSARLVVFFV